METKLVKIVFREFGLECSADHQVGILRVPEDLDLEKALENCTKEYGTRRIENFPTYLVTKCGAEIADDIETFEYNEYGESA